MDRQLVSNLMSGNVKHSPDDDIKDVEFGTTKVYRVEGKKSICKVWNSSNSSSFDTKEACLKIAQKIVSDDSEGGSFSAGFNEIMFEIQPK